MGKTPEVTQMIALTNARGTHNNNSGMQETDWKFYASERVGDGAQGG